LGTGRWLVTFARPPRRALARGVRMAVEPRVELVCWGLPPPLRSAASGCTSEPTCPVRGEDADRLRLRGARPGRQRVRSPPGVPVLTGPRPSRRVGARGSRSVPGLIEGTSKILALGQSQRAKSVVGKSSSKWNGMNRFLPGGRAPRRGGRVRPSAPRPPGRSFGAEG